MKPIRNLTDKQVSNLLKLDNGEKRNTVIVNKLLKSQKATDDDMSIIFKKRREKYLNNRTNHE